MTVTPSSIDSDIERIAAFENVFCEYLAAPCDESRRRVMTAGQAIEPVMDRLNVTIAMQPPPFSPQQVPKFGITQCALALEDSVFNNSPESSVRIVKFVEEALVRADAQLRNQRTQVVEQRRNPLYWGDRLLRAVLGFPAYLLSLLFGFNRSDVNGAWATALSVTSSAITLVGIWVTGVSLGWW